MRSECCCGARHGPKCHLCPAKAIPGRVWKGKCVGRGLEAAGAGTRGGSEELSLAAVQGLGARPKASPVSCCSGGRAADPPAPLFAAGWGPHVPTGHGALGGAAAEPVMPLLQCCLPTSVAQPGARGAVSAGRRLRSLSRGRGGAEAGWALANAFILHPIAGRGACQA